MLGLIHRRYLPGLSFNFPDVVGAVDKEHAIQVINFVLENARQPSFGLDAHRLAVPVLAFDSYNCRTVYVT